MKFFIPIIALAVAGIVFFIPTKGAMEATNPLVAKREDLREALENAKKIQVVRETLENRYNSLKPDDLANLQKMIPAHVDNVRLVIDINSMADKYGMVLKNIEIGKGSSGNKDPSLSTITGDGPEYLDMRFLVSGSYDAMKLFVTDLSRSLRIVDITDLTFSARDLDLYDFSISLRTYWLQDK